MLPYIFYHTVTLFTRAINSGVEIMASYSCNETPGIENEVEEKKHPLCLKDAEEISAEISRLRRLLIGTVATLLLVLMVLCILIIVIGAGALAS